MTVTEFVTLTLTPPHTLESPLVQATLDKVAYQQADWSGHPLLYFQDVQNPADIYLISGWKDVAVHEKWIVSETNQALLKEVAPLVQITRFAHLAIDFQAMPVDGDVIRWLAVRPEASVPSPLQEVTGRTPRWEAVGRQLDGEGAESILWQLGVYDTKVAESCGLDNKDAPGFVAGGVAKRVSVQRTSTLSE